MNYALFIATASIWLYIALAGKKQYRDFAEAETSEARIKHYRLWIVESWIAFGLFSVVALVTMGEPGKLVRPPVAMEMVDDIFSFLKSNSEAIKGFLAGTAIGASLLVIAIVIRARRNFANPLPGTEKIRALFPATAQERWHGVALSLTAGITEELFFRATMPVILLSISHNATLAIGTSAAAFGLAHIYQGWRGVLQTGALGLLLAVVFLLSGNILAPMALHAAIDLNSLIALPWIARIGARSTQKQTA